MTSGADAIPIWDDSGVIPPSNPDAPVSSGRSPYIVSLIHLVSSLGNTEPRQRLLVGLLDFRAELHNAGLTWGFQWIDGSFVENVEELADRPPNDVDVVTFFHVPDEHTQESLGRDFPGLFDPRRTKASYGVDAYFVPLNQVSAERIIERSIYWNSLWSHTRGGRWKGYLQVDLARNEDDMARAELERIATAGGQP